MDSSSKDRWRRYACDPADMACRYVDGRIAEHCSGTADLMEQLGITVTQLIRSLA